MNPARGKKTSPMANLGPRTVSPMVGCRLKTDGAKFVVDAVEDEDLDGVAENLSGWTERHA